MATREPHLLARFLLVAAFAVFVFLVVNSPARVIYDERYFIKDIPLFHQYGLTPKLLMALNGAVGPLYAVIHAGFEPLTHLSPVGMRLVNVLLLLILGATLLLTFRRLEARDPWVAAGSVLVVPMTWVLAGIALSEMPAMIFVGFSLYCQFRALESVEDRRDCHLWFGASALFIGIAVWGRQPYLLLAGVPVVLALRDRRLWPMMVTFVVIVLAVAVPLFATWHGLTPPSHLFYQREPIVPRNILLSLSYVGICLLLLEPTIFWRDRKSFAILFIAALAANAIFSLSTAQPFRNVVLRLLPSDWLPMYGYICGALSLTLGIGTLLFVCRATWRDRDNPQRVSLGVGLLALSVWPALLGNEYSSRYTAMALPHIVLLAEPWRRWTFATLAAAFIGCTLGAISLQGYYM